jgi:hypothetical protein
VCGFYKNNEKIRKGDKAVYEGFEIIISEAKHIKTDKTMDIVYIKENKTNTLNVPYKTITDMELIQREKDEI